MGNGLEWGGGADEGKAAETETRSTSDGSPKVQISRANVNTANKVSTVSLTDTEQRKAAS